MWLVMIAGAVGTVANIYKRRWSFTVWTVTNALWLAYSLYIHEWPAAGCWAFYLGTSIWGMIKWRTA